MAKEKKLDEKKIAVKWYSYLALLLTIIILSGAFNTSDTPLKALDFNNLLGNFGSMGVVEEGSNVTLAKDFKGIGGSGPKEGLLLTLSVAPAIIFAFGLIEVCIDYKGLDAAEVVFNPFMKPLMGLPGTAAVALVTSLTSSDAGAALTRNLSDEGYINEGQKIIFTTFQLLAPSILINFFVFAPTLDPLLTKPLSIALLMIIVMKFIGAIVARVLVKVIYKESTNLVKEVA